jgi:predicted phage-related endonuclease
MSGLSPSQIAIRSTGIGASEVAAICGLSFYGMGPHSVYLRKRGLVGPSESSLMSRMGHAMERTIEPEYLHEVGIELAPLLDASGEPLTMRHPDHEWALASIDRVRTTDLIPVEIKLIAGKRAHYAEQDPCWCGRKSHMHWGRDVDSIPADVYAQVQWQLFVSGAPWAHVCRIWASDFSAPEFRIHTIKRSEVDIAWLFENVRKFWFDNVLAGVPPEPDSSDDSELCERLHARKVLRGMEQAPLGTETFVEQYLDGDRMIQDGENKKAEASNWLRRIIGHSEGLECTSATITNRARKDGARVLKVKPK